MQKSGCRKVEKSVPKGTSKVIVDAERHRRTPWTLAVESKQIESKNSADVALAPKKKKRTCQNHSNTIKMAPKIHPKSMKNLS